MVGLLPNELWSEMQACANANLSGIRLTQTNLGPAFQVYDGRRKVGPLVFPGTGQTLGQTLDMLLGVAEASLMAFDSEDALTDFLQKLNDAGTDPTVAGMTSDGQPFLAMLRGAYADDHVVLFNTPWDGEVSFPATRCEDCGAGEPSTFSDLTFPILVVVQHA